jgi:hypothetical protein
MLMNLALQSRVSRRYNTARQIQQNAAQDWASERAPPLPTILQAGAPRPTMADI